MSEYLLFVGDDFYPSGGWKDFEGVFSSKEDCVEWTNKNYPNAYCKWMHIAHEGKIILKGCEDQGMRHIFHAKWRFEGE